jgi:hypothetical protein
MRHVSAVGLLLVAALSALAAPPEVPRELKCEPGQLLRIPVKGAGEIGYQPTFEDSEAFFDELLPTPGARRFVFQSLKPGTYHVTFWTLTEKGGTTCKIVVGGKPDDKKDEDKKDDEVVPPPKPAATFRAFVVYAAGVKPTAAQVGVIDGVALERALNEACAGDAARFAWRKIDRHASPATLPDGLREAWTAAQKSIAEKMSTPPMLVFQVNDRITIEPLPATGAEAAAMVAKYRGK